VIKAKEPSSLDRKPPRAPCLGVPISEDNPEGDHSTKLLRVVTEVRKGIAKNAAQSKWADKHDVIVNVTPPCTAIEEVDNDLPALIPLDASVHPSLPLAAVPTPSHSSIPSQDQQPASSSSTSAQTTTNLTLLSAPTATNSTQFPPRPAANSEPRRTPMRVHEQTQPKSVKISSFFQFKYSI